MLTLAGASHLSLFTAVLGSYKVAFQQCACLHVFLSFQSSILSALIKTQPIDGYPVFFSEAVQSPHCSRGTYIGLVYPQLHTHPTVPHVPSKPLLIPLPFSSLLWSPCSSAVTLNPTQALGAPTGFKLPQSSELLAGLLACSSSVGLTTSISTNEAKGPVSGHWQKGWACCCWMDRTNSVPKEPCPVRLNDASQST
ncbi:hypothetical protein B0T13DRAFT_57742 [Neurospora crassa]|nr:hypothetical protein B0T13DRAFT_57742 [Neurospora crassa]